MQISLRLAPIIDLMFPPRCPLCGTGLSDHGGLCATCWSDLAIPGEPSCALCQRPFPETIPEGSICAPCLTNPPRHGGIAAGTLYNDASRKLVLSFKHGKRIALAPLMARLMAARLRDVGPDWILVPVPLHRWRLWHRGFNQSALLAQELAKLTGAQVVVDGLLRRKATPMLGGLGRKARARALAGAFAINPARAEALRGARILLVDDVLTSGATTEAALGVLLRVGARSVRISCFARVLDEALPLSLAGAA